MRNTRRRFWRVNIYIFNINVKTAAFEDEQSDSHRVGRGGVEQLHDCGLKNKVCLILLEKSGHEISAVLWI